MGIVSYFGVLVGKPEDLDKAKILELYASGSQYLDPVFEKAIMDYVERDILLESAHGDDSALYEDVFGGAVEVLAKRTGTDGFSTASILDPESEVSAYNVIERAPYDMYDLNEDGLDIIWEMPRWNVQDGAGDFMYRNPKALVEKAKAMFGGVLADDFPYESRIFEIEGEETYY